MAFFSPTTAIRRASVAGETAVTGLLISFMGSSVDFTPWRGARRASRSLMASPRPSLGTGMTAMVATPDVVERAQVGKQIGAASTRSPAGDRLSTSAACSAPGGSLGPKASSASPGLDARRPAAEAALAVRSATPACRARSAPPDRRRSPARRRARCRARARSPARGRPPGRSSTGRSRQATMVDSTPTVAGPPSTIRSMRPPRSSSTCCAVVGET